MRLRRRLLDLALSGRRVEMEDRDAVMHLEGCWEGGEEKGERWVSVVSRGRIYLSWKRRDLRSRISPAVARNERFSNSEMICTCAAGEYDAWWQTRWSQCARCDGGAPGSAILLHSSGKRDEGERV